MKKLFLFFLFAFNCLASFSQKQGNIWCFGDSAGIDFNQSPPTTFTSKVRNKGSCCSIADTSGSLLFYANTRAGRAGNTTQIWSSNNQLMQNGDSIVGQGWFYELVIVPNPTFDSTYYLFSIGVTNSGDSGLYYSMVDMKLNGGLGAVALKNIRLQSFKCDDQLTSIKHANGRDWWLLFRESSAPNNIIYSYLISTNGISNLITNQVGSVNNGYLKRMVISSDGSKIACTNYAGLIEILGFNRCSGIFNGPINISNEFETPYTIGAEISADNNVLYISTDSQSPDTSYLFQYNLADTNIRLTKDTIHIYTYPPSVYEAGMLKLGPDNKIYVANGYYNGVQNFFPYADSMYNFVNMNLSVINQPNNLGSACDFQPYSFNLGGKRSYLGLPNNPDYDMGPIPNSICDTVTSVTTLWSKQNAAISIFYHTSWQTAFVNASGLKGSRIQLVVMDLSGRIVYSENSECKDGFFTRDLSMSNFASGMYLISIFTEREKLTGKMVKP